jgi:hypothetical protein
VRERFRCRIGRRGYGSIEQDGRKEEGFGWYGIAWGIWENAGIWGKRRIRYTRVQLIGFECKIRRDKAIRGVIDNWGR